MAGTGRSLDVAALAAVEDEFVAVEAERSRLHARSLRAALRLAQLHQAAGSELLTVPALGLLLGCSEHRAQQLVTESQVLSSVHLGIATVEQGLLTVEGSRAVADLLGPVEPGPRARAWELLLARLRDDAATGAPRTPARLRELIRRVLLRVDAEGVEARRKETVKATTDVVARKRDDGLMDLFLIGVSAPDCQAIQARFDRAADQPLPGQDDLTAGQRRLRTYVDALLGRCRLTDTGDRVPPGCPCATSTPSPATGVPAGAAGAGAAGAGAAGAVAAPGATVPAGASAACGCLPGSGSPCGAQISVLLPIGAALGTTDELAELAGHGPLTRDETRALLRNRPVVRPVWVDQRGLPVAVGDTVHRPGSDSEALRRVLLDLQGQAPPGDRYPRHPDDHAAALAPLAVGQPRADAGAPPSEQPPPAADPTPTVRVGSGAAADAGTDRAPERPVRPQLLTHVHPTGAPGPYRPSTRLSRFLALRSPRCEWPGCGSRATRCDDDHDLAHPAGPTCSCNLGPLCRRHHRCKQTGLHKTRTSAGGVTWTSPTGRTWHSPAQHHAPEQPVRPPQPARSHEDLVAEHLDLGPLALEDEVEHQEHLALLDDERWSDLVGALLAR